MVKQIHPLTFYASTQVKPKEDEEEEVPDEKMVKKVTGKRKLAPKKAASEE